MLKSLPRLGKGGFFLGINQENFIIVRVFTLTKVKFLFIYLISNKRVDILKIEAKKKLPWQIKQPGVT
jgi:hypothetical protein